MSRRRHKHSSQNSQRALESQVRVIRDNVRLQQLKMEELRGRALLGAMAVAKLAPAMESSVELLDNIVNPADYLGDSLFPYRGTAYGYSIPSSIWHKEEGRNYPIYFTEVDLRAMRGMAFIIGEYHPMGVGILSKLVNYTIGTGLTPRVEADKNSKIDSQIVAQVQRVIDTFVEENLVVGDADRERFRRKHKEGEGNISLWHEGGGHVALRFVEPDQITQPSAEQQIIRWLEEQDAPLGRPSNMWFGVHSDNGDVNRIHGYYVQWSADGQDWDYIPGGRYPAITPANRNTWIEVDKANVDRNQKRGVTDFFPTESTMRLYNRLVRNTGEGSSVQAAIAFIRQHAPGVTAEQLSGFQLGQAVDTIQRTTPQGSESFYVKKYEPGGVVDCKAGMQYADGVGTGERFRVYAEVADALARSCAVRWDMPEWMLNGSAENNNRASSFVAESPFIKNVEVAQFQENRYWERIYWKVIWFNCECGALKVPYDFLRANLHIQVKGAQINTRDPIQTTQRLKILNDDGIISDQTRAQEEGFDHEQEVKEGAKPKNVPPSPNLGLNPTAVGGQPPSSSTLGGFNPRDRDHDGLVGESSAVESQALEGAPLGNDNAAKDHVSKGETLFHGTIKARLGTILKLGIVPGKFRNYDPNVYLEGRKNKVYISTSRSVAERYARDLSFSRQDSSPVILEIRVPKGETLYKDLGPETREYGKGKSFYHQGKIPASWIVGAKFYNYLGQWEKVAIESQSEDSTATSYVVVLIPKVDDSQKGRIPHNPQSLDLPALARQAGVDIQGIDLKELQTGINEEQEHTGAKGKDTKVITNNVGALKIAVAHLREDPKYYTKLKRVMRKSNG